MRPALSRSLGFVAAPVVFWGPFALEIAHRFVLTIAAPLAVIAVFIALRRRQRPGESAWPLALAMLAGIWLATPLGVSELLSQAGLGEIVVLLLDYPPGGFLYVLFYQGSIGAFFLANAAILLLAETESNRARDAAANKIPGAYVLRESPPVTGSGR